MKALKAILISTTALSAGVLIGVPEPMNAAQRSFLRVAPAFAQNPCAARNPCDPGANPCNPCAGGGAVFSKRCVVPRLRQAAANACAAKANPCTAKASSCGAKANPCAAKANPCGGAEAAELQPNEAVAAYD